MMSIAHATPMAPISFREKEMKNIEMKLSMPLTSKTDALKMKELTTRFTFADFHVTDLERNSSYRVMFDKNSVAWSPQMLWFDTDFSWFKEPDAGTPFYCFPRSFKLELTTQSGIKKDITNFFN